MKIIRIILCLVATTTLLVPVFGQGATLAPGAESISVGSDSVDSLLQIWIAAYKETHPGLRLVSYARETAEGVQALISGNAIMAPASREWTSGEIQDFEATWGYRPLRLVVAQEALLVAVNKSNPIRQIRMEQLDAIYSRSRKSGAPDSIDTWGPLGPSGDWTDRPILLLGREATSGSYRFFQNRVLMGGDYKHGIKVYTDGWALADALAADPAAIAYVSSSETTPKMKVLPIVPVGGKGGGILPTEDTIQKGTYPLTRSLLIYVNKTPDKPFPEALLEFFKWIYSKDSAGATKNGGCFPLPADMGAQNLKRLQ